MSSGGAERGEIKWATAKEELYCASTIRLTSCALPQRGSLPRLIFGLQQENPDGLPPKLFRALNSSPITRPTFLNKDRLKLAPKSCAFGNKVGQSVTLVPLTN